MLASVKTANEKLDSLRKEVARKATLETHLERVLNDLTEARKQLDAWRQTYAAALRDDPALDVTDGIAREGERIRARIQALEDREAAILSAGGPGGPTEDRQINALRNEVREAQRVAWISIAQEEIETAKRSVSKELRETLNRASAAALMDGIGFPDFLTRLFGEAAPVATQVDLQKAIAKSHGLQLG